MIFGKSYPLQYSGLENSMDCIVHVVAKSLTWLGDFHCHVLAIVNSVAVNNGLWMLGHWYLFKLWFSLDVCPGVEFLDHIVILYLLFKGMSIQCSIVILHVGCTNLHSLPLGRRVPFSRHVLQHLLFVDFLMLTILTDEKWHFVASFNYIYVISSGVEHLFMCFLPIYMSSLEKYLFRSSAHVKTTFNI